MGQEITQVIELVDKDIKTVVTIAFHMFKKLEYLERLDTKNYIRWN